MSSQRTKKQKMRARKIAAYQRFKHKGIQEAKRLHGKHQQEKNLREPPTLLAEVEDWNEWNPEVDAFLDDKYDDGDWCDEDEEAAAGGWAHHRHDPYASDWWLLMQFLTAAGFTVEPSAAYPDGEWMPPLKYRGVDGGIDHRESVSQHLIAWLHYWRKTDGDALDYDLSQPPPFTPPWRRPQKSDSA